MQKVIKKLFEVKKAGISLQRDTKAYNYSYATLDQIQSKLNPELEKQSLVVIHTVKDNTVFTKIMDIESGEFVESGIEMTTTKPQDKGSEITYYRRYNLVCLLDLEVEDDDGKKAQNSKDKKQEDTQEKPYFPEAKFKALEAKKDVYKNFDEALKAITKTYQLSLTMEIKIKKLYVEIKPREENKEMAVEY